MDLLRECRQAFHDARDIGMLGVTLTALADAEDKRGHGETAIGLERDALRYLYLEVDVPGTAVSYHNLGNYLRDHARQPGPALASHLAAALIRTLADADGAERSAQSAATDLRTFGARAEPPANVADLCRRIADIPGTDPARLITRLSPDPDTAEQALRDLIAQAQALATAPSGDDNPQNGRGPTVEPTCGHRADAGKRTGVGAARTVGAHRRLFHGRPPDGPRWRRVPA